MQPLTFSCDFPRIGGHLDHLEMVFPHRERRKSRALEICSSLFPGPGPLPQPRSARSPVRPRTILTSCLLACCPPTPLPVSIGARGTAALQSCVQLCSIRVSVGPERRTHDQYKFFPLNVDDSRRKKEGAEFQIFHSKVIKCRSFKCHKHNFPLTRKYFPASAPT